MKRVLFLLFCGFLSLSVVGEELTVATFNIRYAGSRDRGNKNWEKRKQVVVEAIRKIDPDILGVQEALAKQVAYLERELPGYKRIGVGRDDGKKKGEYCAIFYRTKRISPGPEANGTFWLSDTPEKPGSKNWGNQTVRICTHGEFFDRVTKKAFHLYNTHWDHRHQGAREKSAELIFRRSKTGRSDSPRIVLGDFNATETNPAMRSLMRTEHPAGPTGSEGVRVKNPLRSAFLELHPEEPNRRTFNGWVGNKEGKAMIDHILVTPQWTVKKAWIEYYQRDGIWPSDHYPVAAVLQLKE